jgi:hypothetical protein
LSTTSPNSPAAADTVNERAQANVMTRLTCRKRGESQYSFGVVSLA